MPTILLITEQERVRQLFTGMEQGGMFRLRVAPTLGQGEEEISVRLPHFVFVENRMSGLPGAAIVAYLRDLLPEGSEVILMARDAAEIAECREVGGLFFLDLSESDEALRYHINDVVPRYVTPQTPVPSEPLSASTQTAREVLSHQPDREALATKDKRLLWLIPLGLAAISLGVVAYRASEAPPTAPQKAATASPNAATAASPRAATAAVMVPIPEARKAATAKAQSVSGPAAKSATPEAPKIATAAVKVASVAPRAEGAAAELGPGPAAARKIEPHRTAAKSAAPSVKVSAQTRRNPSYIVRPGDKLLKVLVKNFGFSEQDAVSMVPELKRVNKLSDSGIIKPGQTIIIPAGK
jgi:pyruvate/2-oxoglutarate dehydrogenase complex dihydrolipoamide acyltransferase (E2) component